MIKLDCSYGEGGGQIIRTALALSTVTGKPFSATNIRKGRKEPGLKAQHLHCIRALEKLCNAKSAYSHLGSDKLEFVPGEIKGGKIEVDIGTAGSISLLLQSLLLPSMFAKKKTTLIIKGGTSGKWAMPFDFFNNTIVPQLQRFSEIKSRLIKRGYYPKGGGEVKLEITPKADKSPIYLLQQGTLMQIKGISHASSDLESAKVAERQANKARILLSKYDCKTTIQSEYTTTPSIGSGISLWAIFSVDDEMDMKNPVRIGADSLGEKGKPAEKVGETAANKLIREISSGAPVDSYTADNLIPFIAMFGGSIKVSEITPHTRANIWVCEQFTNREFTVEENIISCF